MCINGTELNNMFLSKSFIYFTITNDLLKSMVLKQEQVLHINCAQIRKEQLSILMPVEPELQMTRFSEMFSDTSINFPKISDSQSVGQVKQLFHRGCRRPRENTDTYIAKHKSSKIIVKK